MGTRTIKIKECDHPDCTDYAPHSRDMPAPGVHARVTFVDEGHGKDDGTTVAVYACSAAHLAQAAVDAANKINLADYKEAGYVDEGAEQVAS